MVARGVGESSKARDTAQLLVDMGGGEHKQQQSVSTVAVSPSSLSPQKSAPKRPSTGTIGDKKGKKRRPGPIAFNESGNDKAKGQMQSSTDDIQQPMGSPFQLMSAAISPYFLSSFVSMVNQQTAMAQPQNTQNAQNTQNTNNEGSMDAGPATRSRLVPPSANAPGVQSSLKKGTTASQASSEQSNSTGTGNNAASESAGGNFTPFWDTSFLSAAAAAMNNGLSASPLPANFSLGGYLPSPGAGGPNSYFLPPPSKDGKGNDSAGLGNNMMMQHAASMLVGQAQVASLLLEQAKAQGILADSEPTGTITGSGTQMNKDFSLPIPPSNNGTNVRVSHQQKGQGQSQMTPVLPTPSQIFSPPPGTPTAAWSLGLNAGLSAGLAASANIQQNGALSPFLQAFTQQLDKKGGSTSAGLSAGLFGSPFMMNQPVQQSGSFPGGMAKGGVNRISNNYSMFPTGTQPTGQKYTGPQAAESKTPKGKRKRNEPESEGVTNVASEQMFTQVGSNFQCTKCKHKSSRKSDIKKHFRTHTKVKPYKCTLCDARFSDASTRSRHVKAHAGQGRLKCGWPGCTKQFSRKSNMERHVKQGHLGEDPDSGIDSEEYKKYLAKHGMDLGDRR